MINKAKNMNYKKLLIIIACFLYIKNLKADAIISLFLRPYPIIPETSFCQEVAHALKKPGKLAEYCVFGILDEKDVAGIFATYGGYLDVSDSLGHLVFPYKHPKPVIQLLVTHRITPIMIIENTVDHWEIEKDTPAAMYSIERKQDENTKLFYWDTQPASLPDKSNILPETMIIIAQPHYVYVPIGVSLTQESPHLVLPEIYIKRGINSLSDALYMLNLAFLFEPIHFIYKKEPQRYITQPDI
jgi:hypothetical protein